MTVEQRREQMLVSLGCVMAAHQSLTLCDNRIMTLGDEALAELADKADEAMSALRRALATKAKV